MPILGCEPDIAALYSSESGARRIFEDAKVDRGPSDTDIYTINQVEIYKFKCIFQSYKLSRQFFHFQFAILFTSIGSQDRPLLCLCHYRDYRELNFVQCEIFNEISAPPLRMHLLNFLAVRIACRVGNHKS